MIKLLPRFAVPTVLISIFALNAWADSGINLSWDDCGAAGAANKTNTCASNSGAQTMYLSFIPPAGEDSLEAVIGVVDITSSSGLIPSWWDMGTGGCRAAKISLNGNFTAGPFTCTDFWAGQASGGLSYDAPFDSVNFSTSATALNVNHARCRMVEGTQTHGPVDSSTEYYFCSLTILNSLTTGVGSCAGCTIPMCIVFNSAALSEPAPAPDVVLASTPTGGRNQITFQGPGADCSAVPVRNKTWGQIKGLYR